MDLAKIRKKLKEKEEKKSSGKPLPDEVEDHKQKTAERVEEHAELEEVVLEEEASPDEAPPAEESAEQDKENIEEVEEVDDLVEFLVFTLSDEYYAFRLPDLQEVLKEQIITFVPKMPYFIRGVTSLRGKIIPVMDLKKRLSIEEDTEKGTRKQMIILKGPRGMIGVIIDKVVGVRRIEEELLSEPPSHLDEKQIAFIESIVRDKKLFISILNTEEVFDFRAYSLGRRAS